MKVVALVVARMGSTRLPGKALLPVLGAPMVERMIERVRRSSLVDEVVIATTTLDGDDALAKLAERIGVACFRGSADDVLNRVHDAARDHAADVVVELLGDNPLVHSELIDDVLAFQRAEQCDYAASVTTEYPHAPPDMPKFPIGVRVQAFTAEALHRCAKLAVGDYHRENSMTFLYEHPEVFNVAYLGAVGRWKDVSRPELTFAVNYRQNYELVTRIFEACHPSASNFGLPTLLRFYDSSPELRRLMGVPGGGK